MSVLMTFRIAGDARRLEEFAARNEQKMRDIAERAKQHGLISHRFYGSDNEILVVDEWPSPDDFQSFFSATESEIRPMMAEAGVSGEPTITFWRKLDTKDDVGYERGSHGARFTSAALTERGQSRASLEDP